ncbi:GerAB/ArcD/ProY family transporter [Sediminibacillus albus]|uniref:Spore germination protein (Amino acid permease) n=1 Tax=Sediminibacillus albus TaxID=407036 RepID=A0A1G9AA25_9BACI|nr:endospore germination permease [Sediminibacillus albus]SDK23684.1 spore germination protein (amino acid permease) [Sediminibacillus albus]
MFKKESRLGAREGFAMITMMIGVKISNTTPSMFAQTGANAFWLMPLISMSVILPSVILLYYLLKRYKDKNLVELTEHILGKHVGKFVAFLLFVIFFTLLAIEGRSYTEQLKMLYFPESPTPFIFFIFFMIAFYGAKRGLETIGSTAWAFFFYIKASVILLAFLALREVIFARIFPIFGNGLVPLLTEGAKKASLFSDIFLLAMAYTAFDSTKKFRKGVFSGFAFVFLEMTFFFLLYCTIFDYNSIDKVAFPFHEITQYVNMGNFFTNIETFFMIFWLFAALIKYMIYLYLISWIFGAVFNIKEFEPLILPFAFFGIVAGMVPENAVINELVFKSNFMDMITPFLIFFPFLLWVTAKFKGDLKR